MSTPVNVDMGDPDLFEVGIPFELFARLRAEEPVKWNPAGRHPAFWSVTRHRDVLMVNRDITRFSAALGVLLHEDEYLKDPASPRMMIEMDPPQHSRYRMLVNRGFTPRMIGLLTDYMRETAREIVTQAVPKREFDFVAEISALLPMRMISNLLGIPSTDHEYLYQLTNRVFGSEDPEFGEDTGGGPDLAARDEMFAYAKALRQEKRKILLESRPDDIISQLIAADIDGDELSEEEFEFFVFLLISAGNETTRTAISQGMLAYIAHPDQWDRVVADRSLLSSAADEILRYTTPLYYMRRTALVDLEIAGVAIAAGDHVVVWYASANHDPEVFKDPDRFDVGRKPNPHVAFGGGGPHYCLGASLARLELEVMFDELMNAGVRFELAGEPQLLRSGFANGVKSLPVRIA